MRYKNETGIILSPDRDVLHIVDGHPGHVEFPKSVIWGLHQKQPGSVYWLAHTHPLGVPNLSNEDLTTLQGWARALYPFPVRMSVTTQMRDGGSPFKNQFMTTRELAIWESIESWIERGKPTEGRRVSIFTEAEYEFTMDMSKRPFWEELIITKSYDW